MTNLVVELRDRIHALNERVQHVTHFISISGGNEVKSLVLRSLGVSQKATPRREMKKLLYCVISVIYN